MEKKSEVDERGIVRWGGKGLMDAQASERLRGLTADEEARVEVMGLTENKLTVAPRELLELGGLKWLSLSRNFISSLPSFIGHLTPLEVLSLFGNELATLPVSMTSLQKLERYVNPRFSCFLSAHFLALPGSSSGATTGCRSISRETPLTTNPPRPFSRTLRPSLSSATKRCGPRR